MFYRFEAYEGVNYLEFDNQIYRPPTQVQNQHRACGLLHYIVYLMAEKLTKWAKIVK